MRGADGAIPLTRGSPTDPMPAHVRFTDAEKVYGAGQPLCLVQKLMPPAVQQTQPPSEHDAFAARNVVR